MEQTVRRAYVGHAEGTTEATSYVNLSEHYADEWAAMVRAILPIDWTGPKGGKASNVVQIQQA